MTDTLSSMAQKAQQEHLEAPLGPAPCPCPALAPPCPIPPVPALPLPWPQPLTGPQVQIQKELADELTDSMRTTLWMSNVACGLQILDALGTRQLTSAAVRHVTLWRVAWGTAKAQIEAKYGPSLRLVPPPCAWWLPPAPGAAPLRLVAPPCAWWLPPVPGGSPLCLVPGAPLSAIPSLCAFASPVPLVVYVQVLGMVLGMCNLGPMWEHWVHLALQGRALLYVVLRTHLSWKAGAASYRVQAAAHAKALLRWHRVCLEAQRAALRSWRCTISEHERTEGEVQQLGTRLSSQALGQGWERWRSIARVLRQCRAQLCAMTMNSGARVLARWRNATRLWLELFEMDKSSFKTFFYHKLGAALRLWQHVSEEWARAHEATQRAFSHLVFGVPFQRWRHRGTRLRSCNPSP